MATVGRRPGHFTGRQLRVDVRWAESVWRDHWKIWPILGWLGITLFAIGILVFYFHDLPGEVPMFYSRTWGVEQLASKRLLFLLPGGAFLLGLADVTLGLRLEDQELFLVRVLFLAAPFLAILAAIAQVGIILVIR